jgi:hypothetical protein
MAVAQPEAMSAMQLTTSAQLLSRREIIFDLSTVRFIVFFGGGFLGFVEVVDREDELPLRDSRRELAGLRHSVWVNV